MRAKKWAGMILMVAMMIGFLSCHKSEEAEPGWMETMPKPTIADADVPAQEPGEYETFSVNSY